LNTQVNDPTSEEALPPRRVYFILAHHNLVRSIDEFLDLTVGQTELLLQAISEYYEEQKDALTEVGR